jgi:hypothetical protein
MTSVNLMAQVLFYKNSNNALQSYNQNTQTKNDSNESVRCRGCNQNLTSSDPASQYQRQKIIQNTVRVKSSLYTMNLAGLMSYQKPLNTYQLVEQAGTSYYTPPGVNWNQMSDRPSPSVQTVKTGSGSAYGASSTKHTIVRNRPGAMSPGGVGVDIKHNSYDRYLNRLKGKSVLRRGVIPPNFGAPIQFNRAYPVYGGKTVKMSIINDCDCPDINNNLDADTIIYGSKSSALQDQILSVKYEFHVNDLVWAKKNIMDTIYYKGIITQIIGNDYTILFDDGSIATVPGSSLTIYFECNCSQNGSIEEQILNQQYQMKNNNYFTTLNNVYCSILNTASEIL